MNARSEYQWSKAIASYNKLCREDCRLSSKVSAADVHLVSDAHNPGVSLSLLLCGTECSALEKLPLKISTFYQILPSGLQRRTHT